MFCSRCCRFPVPLRTTWMPGSARQKRDIGCIAELDDSGYLLGRARKHHDIRAVLLDRESIALIHQQVRMSRQHAIGADDLAELFEEVRLECEGHGEAAGRGVSRDELV